MAGPATALLFLDVDDEITSAASRIRSSEADRVGLVLPYGSRLATSRINFRLLAREATERGKTLEIVAADASARSLAISAGLAVHQSVAAFEGRDGGPGGSVPGGTVGGGLGADADVPGAAGAVASGDSAATAESAASTAGGLRDHRRARGVGAGVPRADDSETGVLAMPGSGRRVPIVGRARPPVRSKLAVGVAVAVLAIAGFGAVAAYLLLPSASITLAPRSEDVGPLALVVDAQPGSASPDPAKLTVPAQTFTFDLSVSQPFSATGVKVTESRASGDVTFSSFDTGSSTHIPSGVTVKTQAGTAFHTVADVTLPPATIDFNPLPVVTPSTSSVGIQAVAAGPGGNVAAGTITVPPKGVNKNLISVTNRDATTGGARTESPQVTAADFDGALRTLNDALVAQLDTKIAASEGVPAGTTVFAETKQLGPTTPSVARSAVVGKVEAQFELGLTGQGTALGVDSGPIRALAASRLQAATPVGWRLVEGSIDIQVGTPNVFGASISFPVSARATRVRVVDRDTLLAQIRGLDLPAARARLDAYGDAEITVWPDWVTTVPTNADRVSFTLADARPAASPSPGASVP